MARRSRRVVRPLKSRERDSSCSASVRKKRKSSASRDSTGLAMDAADAGRKPVTASINSQAHLSISPAAASASFSSPCTRASKRSASSDLPEYSPSAASSRRSIASRMASAMMSLKLISSLRKRARTDSIGCTMATASSILHRVASPLILWMARNRLPMTARSSGVFFRRPMSRSMLGAWSLSDSMNSSSASRSVTVGAMIDRMSMFSLPVVFLRESLAECGEKG